MCGKEVRRGGMVVVRLGVVGGLVSLGAARRELEDCFLDDEDEKMGQDGESRDTGCSRAAGASVSAWKLQKESNWARSNEAVRVLFHFHVLGEGMVWLV